MPRISKVTDTFTKLEYGYMFDIQRPSELLDWFIVVRLPKGAEEFGDASRSREGGNPSGSHATKGAALATMAGIRGTSLADSLVKLNSNLYEGMVRTLEHAGRIFINSNGGYFGFKKSLKIEDTRCVFAYILPSENIRVTQWPNGKHYYAKVGDQDVVIDGIQKWNTFEEARAAADFFLSQQQEGKL